VKEVTASGMAEELGKIEKPSTERFEKGRKLFFVPLVFSPLEPEGEFDEKVKRYWAEAEAHIANLEAKLGSVRKVFHELIPASGELGDMAIKELNSAGYEIVRSRLDKGAELQALEDAELLTEFMDWSRCLAVGLQNPKVITKVYESYNEARSRRNEGLAKTLDESLHEDEIGLLLMREGHQVQFPSDIDVFYVSPPSLDEIKRWLRSREEEAEAAAAEQETAEDSGE
jgi:hypothetical protein